MIICEMEVQLINFYEIHSQKNEHSKRHIFPFFQQNWMRVHSQNMVIKKKSNFYSDSFQRVLETPVEDVAATWIIRNAILNAKIATEDLKSGQIVRVQMEKSPWKDD